MKILEKQLYHFIFLVALIYLALWFWSTDISILRGAFLGIETKYWLYYALIIPILHQIYVLLFWRLELHYQILTKNLGKNAFLFFKVGFTFLIMARPIVLICLAIANAGTLLTPVWLSYAISAVLAGFAIYLAYSIKKYFGFNRAYGLDHFDPSVRELGFVKKGIFKYTSNAMYIFGFLALYIPGLVLFSKAALFMAFWSHLYIWVHYYFVEKPDFKHIYQ